MPVDSTAIDDALLAVLAGDATLSGLMPDGVYFDEAPPNKRQFVLVSLFDETDQATFVEGRTIEDALYVIKAVAFGTTPATALTAAARIDTLLEGATLTVAAMTCMTVHREKRIRYPEVDDLDPSIRWQHHGGHYRVQFSITGA